MKAMILAAGRGERLRPLTDTCPKPLLPVGDAPLIVHHLRALHRAGIREVVINTAWLAEQFERVLGDGASLGVSIRYSAEGASGLETGGGILHALPLLGDAPFLVVNGDIHLDFDFTTLHLREADCAQLLMVDPPDGGHGDFALDSNGRLSPEGAGTRLTYSGVAIIHPALFAGWRAGLSREEVRGDPPIFRLAPVLRHAMRQGRIGGQHHRGHWTDAGTPAALKALETRLRAPSKR